MTMKIFFLKDTGKYKAGYEGFIDRTLGKKLCQEGVAVPWCKKDKISPAQAKAMKKAEAEAKRIAKEKEKEEKAKAQKEKAEKLLKDREKAESEKAVSKKAKIRGRAVKFNTYK